MRGEAAVLSIFHELRDVTLLSVALRMLLASLCGGVIGIEREYKRRPAGFRTHILICLGAAITTLTSQYLYMYMGYDTDISRLGAQVVAGIGFIGAGTIIVTTAAGLWTTAIVGLAIGSGFYEGGLFATILVMIAELVFSKLEYRILNHAPEINLYMEYTDSQCLDQVLVLFRDLAVKVRNMEITRSTGSERHNACAIFTLALNKKHTVESVLNSVLMVEGVISVEEL